MWFVTNKSIKKCYPQLTAGGLSSIYFLVPTIQQWIAFLHATNQCSVCLDILAQIFLLENWLIAIHFRPFSLFVWLLYCFEVSPWEYSHIPEIPQVQIWVSYVLIIKGTFFKIFFNNLLYKEHRNILLVLKINFSFFGNSVCMLGGLPNTVYMVFILVFSIYCIQLII